MGKLIEHKFPIDTPKETRSLLTPIITLIHSLLANNLVGIYLYGSLATGSFQLGSSDIDLILIVKENLSSKEKNKIISRLNKTREQGKSIEISVFLESVVQTLQYPILVELRYDYPDNIFENEPDEEVVSFLYEATERGFCIWGKPLSKVFQNIPAKHYLRSVFQDLKYTRRFLHENPTYWVLNACRTIAFLRERRVLSKLEGGEWGLKNLGEKYHDLINQALSRYQNEVEKGQVSWKREKLEDFAEYIIDEIDKVNPNNF